MPTPEPIWNGLVNGIDYVLDCGRPVLLQIDDAWKEQYIREYAHLISVYISENCADGDWIEFIAGSNTGFSDSDIFRLTADSTEDEIRTAIEDALERQQFPIGCELYEADNVLTLSVDCRIRKGPGLTYETLGILPAGTQVYRFTSVNAPDGTWYEIRYEGGTAFLSSSSFGVKITAAPMTQQPASKSSPTPSPRPTQSIITPEATSYEIVTPTPSPTKYCPEPSPVDTSWFEDESDYF